MCVRVSTTVPPGVSRPVAVGGPRVGEPPRRRVARAQRAPGRRGGGEQPRADPAPALTRRARVLRDRRLRGRRGAARHGAGPRAAAAAAQRAPQRRRARRHRGARAAGCAGSAGRGGCCPTAPTPTTSATVATTPAAVEVALCPPVAGVVGQLNERLDLDALDAVARTGSRLLLVGPRHETRPETRRRLDALIARPNVQWVDRQPFDRLPAFLSAVDVGLTPYTVTEFNRGSHPSKTLEYLAAGRHVVSTDLPASRALGSGAGGAVTSTPEEFATRHGRAPVEAGG